LSIGTCHIAAVITVTLYHDTVMVAACTACTAIVVQQWWMGAYLSTACHPALLRHRHEYSPVPPVPPVPQQWCNSGNWLFRPAWVQ